MDAGPSPARLLICDPQTVYAHGLSTLIGTEADDLAVVGFAASLTGAEGLARRSLPDVALVADRFWTGETAGRLRAVSPKTIVVVLSSECHHDGLLAVLESGAVGYVSKDSDVGDVIDAIRLAVRGYLVVPQTLTDAVVAGLPRPRVPPGERLSPDELVVLTCVAEGATNQEISQRLHLSERTVCRRLRGVYAKLGVQGRLEAVLRAADQLGDVAGAPAKAQY